MENGSMKRNVCFLAAVGLLMVLSACSSDDPEENLGSTERSPTYSVRGVVTDLKGDPLKGIAVVAKKATATTDAEGRYQLNLPEGEAVIQFARADYVGTIKKVTVSKAHPTMLHVKLLGADKAQKLNANGGGEIIGSGNNNGNARVVFPSSAFVDRQGRKVSGEVSVRLTNMDPSTEEVREATPGSFLGSNGGTVTQIESGGMLAVEVRDASGEKLQLAGDAKLQVEFPVNEGMLNPPPTMPLWSFDEEAGQWVMEGEATLSGDGRHYTAELPHMSFWNCDRVLEATCVMGCAKDKETGAPLAGAQVIVSGMDYIGSSWATTGADGCFRVAVMKNASVRITVQHSLSGGVMREFHGAGETGTAVPPTSSDTCADAGEFEVERDVFNYNGLAIDCTSVMASLGGNECLEEMGEMFSCQRAAGDCSYRMSISSTSSEMTTRWDSGARTVSKSGLGGSSLTGYGPEGQLCYSSDMDIANMSSDAVSFVYRDAQGRAFKMGVQGEQFTVECPSGKKFQMSEEESAAMSACAEKQEEGAEGECTLEGIDGGGIEGFCQSAGDCMLLGGSCCMVGGGLIGVCLQEEVCISEGGTPLN